MEDYLTPYYSREIEVIEWVQCIQDEQHYSKSECVFDKDGGVYIHASNLKAFLEDIKTTITELEYKLIKTNLMKQL